MTLDQLPDLALTWPIPYNIVCDIAESEQGPKGGVALKAYRCPAGKWTNGWGETDGVFSGQVIDKATADGWLCKGLTERSQSVQALCTTQPNKNQLGAMVSLSYNIGMEAFAKSSVLRLHNAGDLAGAGRAFGLFNEFTNPKTGQREVSEGLTARRHREAALYMTPDEDEPAAPMPQAVAPESSMAASPINVAGVTTTAVGVATAVSPFLDQANTTLNTIKSISDTLGLHLPVVLGIVLLAAGVVVVYQRLKQRHGGWA